MPQVSLESTVVRAPDVIATELDGELVIFDIEKGAYFGLEATARKLWDLLERPQVVNTICETLYTQYAVEPADCQRDVLHFLNEMHEQGLVLDAQVD